MTEVNAQTRKVAALFDLVAPTYEAVGVPWFVPIAERLVDEVDLHHGEHVLDIGCGRGAAIPALSGAVGHTGRVVGIDVSSKMLEKATQAVSLRGLHNVELFLMDATHPDLPRSSFSAAVASLVLPFLPEPALALQAWHDLLVPLGRLGVTTFAERDPEWVEVDALFTPYLPADFFDIRTTGSRGVFGSDDAVAGLVADAGFKDLRTVRWDYTIDFGSPAQWRSWSMSTGQRGMWQWVPEEARDEVQQQAAAILERRNGAGNPIQLTQTVRLTIGFRRY